MIIVELLNGCGDSALQGPSKHFHPSVRTQYRPAHVADQY